ncbi:MAG: hypothetical protein ABJ275_02470 [Maricaulaceae bacterium]
MTSELNLNSGVDLVDIDVPESDVSIKDIIIEYKVLAIKLGLFADNVPDTETEQKELVKQELRLLDRQATLLETVLSRPINTIEDAKAVLTLWHYEVIKSQSQDSLSAADGLVNSVYEFLQDA